MYHSPLEYNYAVESFTLLEKIVCDCIITDFLDNTLYKQFFVLMLSVSLLIVFPLRRKHHDTIIPVTLSLLCVVIY